MGAGAGVGVSVVSKLPNWLILIPGGLMFIACWTSMIATAMRLLFG